VCREWDRTGLARNTVGRKGKVIRRPSYSGSIVPLVIQHNFAN